MRKHALLNAIVPGIQVIALQLAFLAGGVVVVETLFAYPGIGLQLVDSVRNHDVPMVQALSMIIASGLRRGEPDRGHPVHPVDPAREDGDLVMSTEAAPATSGDRSGGAVDLPQGAAAEAVHGRPRRSPCCWWLFAIFAPFFAPYGENEIVGPPYSKVGFLGTDYLGQDVLSRRACTAASEILVIAVLGTLLGMVLGIVDRRGRGVRRRLVGRGDHAPQRRGPGVPADPAGAARAHRDRAADRRGS